MLPAPAILGVAAGVLSLADPVPYVREILSGRTRPHRGTWLVWSVLAGSALLTQTRTGATWTLLLLGVQAASATLILGLSVRRGVGGTRPGELVLVVVALAGAGTALVMGDSGTGVVLVVLADAGGLVLMLPKTWRDPWSECWQSHLLAGAAGTCAVAAAALAPTRAGALAFVYPVYFTVACLGLGGLVLVRRGRPDPARWRRRAGTCAAGLVVLCTAACGTSTHLTAAGGRTRPLVVSSPGPAAPVDVAYRSLGSGRRVVVLLHGGPGQPSPELLEEFAPLAAAGFRVVYYDQRGVGASPRPPFVPGAYGPQAYVADLERLRVRLGADRLDLIGSSFGGLVEALYTAEHPDRVRALVEADGEPLDLVADEHGQAVFAARLQALQALGVVPSPLPDPADCAASGRAVAPVLAPSPARDSAYLTTLGASSSCCSRAERSSSRAPTTRTASAGRTPTRRSTPARR